MALKLAGKVAVVTGSSRGIGASIARHLAAEGAAVALNYLDSQTSPDAVMSAITAKGGKAIAIQADLTNPADIKRLFSETRQAFGKLDILVNNAGICQTAPIDRIRPEHFHKQFNLNVLGLLLASKHAARHIGPEGGSIINISSVAGARARPGFTVYSASKAAVDAITKSLARELGPRGIRVNAISPGMVETEGLKESGIGGEEMRRSIVARTPLGRLGRPEDIAPAVVFLASADASWITGQNLCIAGGPT